MIIEGVDAGQYCQQMESNHLAEASALGAERQIQKHKLPQ
jgi:hypothetical protein